MAYAFGSSIDRFGGVLKQAQADTGAEIFQTRLTLSCPRQYTADNIKAR